MDFLFSFIHVTSVIYSSLTSRTANSQSLRKRMPRFSFHKSNLQPSNFLISNKLLSLDEVVVMFALKSSKEIHQKKVKSLFVLCTITWWDRNSSRRNSLWYQLKERWWCDGGVRSKTPREWAAVWGDKVEKTMQKNAKKTLPIKSQVSHYERFGTNSYW